MSRCEFQITKEMVQFIRRNKNKIYDTFINRGQLNFRMSRSFENEQITIFRIENNELFMTDYSNKFVDLVLNGIIKENDIVKFDTTKNGNSYLTGLDQNANQYELNVSIYRNEKFKIKIMLYANTFYKNPFDLGF